MTDQAFTIVFDDAALKSQLDGIKRQVFSTASSFDKAGQDMTEAAKEVAAQYAAIKKAYQGLDLDKAFGNAAIQGRSLAKATEGLLGQTEKYTKALHESLAYNSKMQDQINLLEKELKVRKDLSSVQADAALRTQRLAVETEKAANALGDAQARTKTATASYKAQASAIDRLSAANAGLSADLQRLNAQAKNISLTANLETQIRGFERETSSAVKKVLSEFDRLEREAANLNIKGTKAYAAQLNELHSALKQIVKQEAKASAAYTTSSKSMTELSSSASRLDNILTSIGTRSYTASAGLRDLNAVGGLARNVFDGLNSHISLYTGGMLSAAAGTYLATRAARESITVYSDLTGNLQRSAAVMGASVSEMTMLSQEVERLGANTKFTSVEVSEALVQLGMAGLETGEAMASLQPTLQLASIGALDFGEAADLATNIMQGFQLTADDMGRVVDVLATAVTNSNATVQQLANALSYAAPVAESFGISLEMTSAAMAALHNSGIKASRAGTGMRKILLSLYSPTEKAAEALAEMGVSTVTLDQRTRPLLDVLTDMKKAMDAGNASIADLREIVDLRALPAMAQLVKSVGSGTNSLNKLYEAEVQAAGAAEEMQRKIEDYIGSDWLKLIAALQQVGVELLNLYGPSIRDGIQAVTEKIREFIANEEGLREFASAILEISEVFAKAIGVAGLLSFVGTLGSASIKLGLFIAGIYSLISPLKLASSGLAAASGSATVATAAFVGSEAAALSLSAVLSRLAVASAAAFGVIGLAVWAAYEGISWLVGESFEVTELQEALEGAASATEDLSDATAEFNALTLGPALKEAHNLQQKATRSSLELYEETKRQVAALKEQKTIQEQNIRILEHSAGLYSGAVDALESMRSSLSSITLELERQENVLGKSRVSFLEESIASARDNLQSLSGTLASLLDYAGKSDQDLLEMFNLTSLTDVQEADWLKEFRSKTQNTIREIEGIISEVIARINVLNRSLEQAREASAAFITEAGKQINSGIAEDIGEFLKSISEIDRVGVEEFELSINTKNTERDIALLKIYAEALKEGYTEEQIAAKYSKEYSDNVVQDMKAAYARRNDILKDYISLKKEESRSIQRTEKDQARLTEELEKADEIGRTLKAVISDKVDAYEDLEKAQKAVFSSGDSLLEVTKNIAKAEEGVSEARNASAEALERADAVERQYGQEVNLTLAAVRASNTAQRSRTSALENETKAVERQIAAQEKYNEKLVETVFSIDPAMEAAIEYAEAVAWINEAVEQFPHLADKATKRIGELSREFQRSQLDELGKALFDMEHEFDNMDKLAAGWVEQFRDTLADGLAEGKLDFSSFADYVKAELARMAANQIVIDVVGLLSSSGSLGSLFGSTSESSTSSLLSAGGDLLSWGSSLLGLGSSATYSATTAGATYASGLTSAGLPVVDGLATAYAGEAAASSALASFGAFGEAMGSIASSLASVAPYIGVALLAVDMLGLFEDNDETAWSSGYSSLGDTGIPLHSNSKSSPYEINQDEETGGFGVEYSWYETDIGEFGMGVHNGPFSSSEAATAYAESIQAIGASEQFILDTLVSDLDQFAADLGDVGSSFEVRDDVGWEEAIQGSLMDRFTAIFAEIDPALEAAFVDINPPVEEMAGVLATLTSLYDDATSAAGLYATAVAEGLQFQETLDLVSTLQEEGESLTEAYARVLSEAVSVQAALDTFGGSLGMLGLDAAYANQAIVSSAGGLDSFNAGLLALQEITVTEEEAFEALTESLSDSLEELGVDTIPATEMAMEELMRSFDLTTSAGQDLFGQVVALAPAILEWQQAAAALEESSGELVNSADAAAEAIENLADLLAGTYEDIYLDGLTTQQQYEYFADAADDLVSTLGDMESIADVEAAVEEINDLIKNAYDVLDEDQQDAVRDDLLQYIDDIAALSETLINDLAASEEESADSIEDAADSFQDAADDMQSAAYTIQDAAEELKDAAGGLAASGASSSTAEVILVDAGSSPSAEASLARSASSKDPVGRSDVSFPTFPEYPGDFGSADDASSGDSEADDTAAQLADFMTDIYRGLRDLDLTDFQQSLTAVYDSLQDNIESASELGASESELAAIRDLAYGEYQQLIEDREADLADFMSDFSVSLRDLELNDFQLELVGLHDDLRDNILQARELGAAEEDLALIRAESAAQVDALIEEEVLSRVEEARNDLIDSYNEELSALISIQEEIAEAEQIYTQALQEEIAAQSELAGEAGAAADEAFAAADAWSSVADELRQTSSEILSSILMPEIESAFALSDYLTGLSSALSGDEEAMSDLSGLATSYTDSLLTTSASSLEYRTGVSEVQADLMEVASVADDLAGESMAEGEQQLALQEEANAYLSELQTKLDALTALDITLSEAEQDYLDLIAEYDRDLLQASIDYYTAEIDRLSSLDSAVLSLEEALRQYSDALLQALDLGISTTEFETQVGVGPGAYSIAGPAPVMDGPGFSGGGISSGPDSGYYAKMHGTEAHIPIEGGSIPVNIDWEELLYEIAELRSSMEKGNEKVASNTSKSYKLFRNWESRGQPPVRES